MPGERAELVAEVNHLYWETRVPVTEMAERLGISRRTIYDMIRPISAGESCPECGGGMLVYPNRSARMSGEAVCSACERTQDMTLLHELAGATGEEEATARAERTPSRATGLAVQRPGGEVAPRSRTAVGEARIRARYPSPALTTILLAGLLVTLVAALLIPARRSRRWW
jgi:hypothetical protein